jgi:hypothetical protein
MTVKELIGDLQDLPQDSKIIYYTVGKTIGVVHEAVGYNGEVWIEGYKEEKVVLLR